MMTGNELAILYEETFGEGVHLESFFTMRILGREGWKARVQRAIDERVPIDFMAEFGIDPDPPAHIDT